MDFEPEHNDTDPVADGRFRRIRAYDPTQPDPVPPADRLAEEPERVKVH